MIPASRGTLFAMALTLVSACHEKPKQAPANEYPAGWHVFHGTKLGFSIAYPPQWTPDRSYRYPNDVAGQPIGGVSFAIPASWSQHTNLAPDTRLSVESLNGTSPCGARAFLAWTDTERTDHRGDQVWSVATAGDAGAGNFYDETVYALTRSKPCLAIRYFIHFTNIGAYPSGTANQFDRATLILAFDRIRSTFSSPGTD